MRQEDRIDLRGRDELVNIDPSAAFRDGLFEFRRLDDDRCDFLTRANDDSVRGGGDGVGGCFPREIDTDS